MTKPSRSAEIKRAVRAAIAGHKAAGLPIYETAIEIEGDVIRVRIVSVEAPPLTSPDRSALYSDLMAANMSGPAGGGRIGKRAS